jgi:hypothetical protein
MRTVSSMAVGLPPAAHQVGMRPTVAFANYVHTIKVTQKVRCLDMPLTAIFHVRSTDQPTIPGVALCHKNIGDPRFNGLTEGTLPES